VLLLSATFIDTAPANLIDGVSKIQIRSHKSKQL